MAESTPQAEASSSSAPATGPNNSLGPDLEKQLDTTEIEQEGPEYSVDVPTNRHGFHYEDRRLGRYPKGLSRFCQEQSQITNGGIHRRFKALRYRCLYDDEIKIAAIEEEIRQLDMDIARPRERSKGKGKSKETSNKAPSQPLLLLSPPSPSNSTWDGEKERRRCELMEEVKTRLDIYSKRLLQEREFQKLPRITRQEHYNLFTNARDGQKMSQEELQFLLDPDDFITTKMERHTRPFEWLVFDRSRNPWWHHVLLRLINTKPLEGSTYPTHFHSRWLKILITIPVMALALAQLLSPVIVLYLVPMSKAASAGVVVAFGFAFTLAMTMVPGIALDSIFIGLSAYMAVLVTFLANLNLQGGQCQC
ncbi:hypothetical protein B0T19DRAFT_484337 [Cercophora scortea]|uniref:DUF6594 domain-containing protein n=1 Tax=Cercophora scortea TaxID=314031 RepID=A0AAE0ILV0_9PEZI|nr:hypothetical protein B0T19DRAFT_484337 [Cercophora scortea]